MRCSEGMGQGVARLVMAGQRMEKSGVQGV